MAGIRFLHRVHGKRAQGIRQHTPSHEWLIPVAMGAWVSIVME
jgi:hypothetical protein